MKKKWFSSNALLLSSALCFSPAAFALGLGEVQIHSKLNQTLDAEIEIISATQAELDALQVSVPSVDVFKRYDLDRSRLVSNLQFSVENRGNQRRVIRVFSNQPVKEPFLTFLVQADWRQGKLLREYTVLIDPPTFVPGQSNASTYADPAANTVYSGGSIERRVGDTITVTPDYQSTQSYRIPDANDGTRMVQRGDTLSKIAKQVKPDSAVSMQQAMLAIFRANPDAFDGNINRLRAGKTLRIPSRSEFGQIDRSAAIADVKQQMQDWRAGRRSKGTLELRVPDINAEANTSETTSLGTTGQSTSGDRVLTDGEKLVVAEQEEKIRELQRLLNTKDHDLAILQDQLRELGVETEAQVETTEDPLSADIDAEGIDQTIDEEMLDAGDGEIDAEDIVDVDITEVDTAEVDSAEIVTPTPVVEKAPVVSTVPVETTSWWQPLLKYLSWLLGLLALGAAGLFGYKKLKNDQPDRDSLFVDEELDSTIEDIANSVKADVHSRYTDSVPALENISAEADLDFASDDTGYTSQTTTVETPQIEVEEIDFEMNSDSDAKGDTETFFEGTIEQEEIKTDSIEVTELESGEYSASKDGTDVLPFEDTTLADASGYTGSMELDQNNPIAEADFHMAYGLYDQAIELVKGAIKKEDKLEFKEKLLEIYFVSGNKEEFVKYADNVKDELQVQSPNVWDNIAIMGKQLAPESELFSGALNASDSDDGLDFAFGVEETGSLEIDSSLFSHPGDASQVIDSIDLNLSDSGAIHVPLDFDLEAQLGADPSENTESNIELISPDVEISDADFEIDFALEATGETTVDEIHEQKASTASMDSAINTVIDSIPDVDDTHKLESVDLDLDIGSATGAAIGLTAELDAALEEASSPDTLEVSAIDEIDFDMGELGLTNAGEIGLEISQADESEDTLNFGSDEYSVEGFTGTSGSFASENAHTAIMDVGPSIDDTLDFNFASALEGVDADPFPDATMPKMVETELDSLLDDISNPDDEHASTAQITEDELAAMGLSNDAPIDDSDLMDATNFGFDDMDLGDEVSTKLDLARAYIEMDDNDNAKSILKEVVAEGSSSQVQEAKDLLHSLA